MGIGTVCPRRAHADLQPERPLFAKADAEGARRLAIEERIAVHLRMVLHEVARTVGPEGFLVGDGGQRQLAAELLRETIEIDVSENRGGGAGLHVGDATAIDLAVHHLPAPWIT